MTTIFILDYALIDPMTAIQSIINATSRHLWAIFRDIDEDRFLVEVFNPFEGEEIRTEDLAWATLVLSPWLFRE